MDLHKTIAAKKKWLINITLAIQIITLSHSVYSQKGTVINIESSHNAIALQVDTGNRVGVIYFGEKLKNRSEYGFIPAMTKRYADIDYSGIFNSAYTPAGSRNLVEPAVQVTHADGNTSLDLQYVSHTAKQIENNIFLTTILLKDPVYPFEVTLYYKVYQKEDVVEQWSVIKHTEKGNVVLQKFASANLFFSSPQYWLRQYHGDWAREMQPEESRLTPGIKVLDSKLGTRENLYQPPSFMVSFNTPATEDEGKVLLGSVEWSGNFRVDLEVDPLNNLRLIAGMNNYASEYSLKPSEEFTTPAFLYTYSTKGKGEASRNLHDWAREYRILNGNGSRETILNNWESTFFDFNEPILSGLLKDTKKLGVDVFLLDDGWFGNKYPRNSDNAGLGDWQENRKKLPNGLGYLAKEAQKNGVKFGIWVEPEMVSPKSELYEKHRDWVIREPERSEHLYRNQLVLDLSNPKVQDFLVSIFDTLFIKNPDLAFIKWDCNAVIYNAHSQYEQKQSHLYIDYVRGLYKVMDRIRAKYPKVPMMLCSGGGGRVDYGALKYFTEFWVSDNTDPLERVFMQYEYSYFFPSVAHDNHVTDWGKQPIKFRTDVAMMGKLGFDIVVNKLSENDLKFCQQSVANYKSFSEEVWHGDLYRLMSPKENDLASLVYVNKNKNKAIMFNYLVNYRFGGGSILPIKLKGLQANKRYSVKETNLYPGTKSTLSENTVFSGDYLMTVGFNPDVNVKRSSVILEINEASKP